jgi:hypothetical protein
MSGQKNYSTVLIEICILLVVGAATALVFAQQGKVVSSYGPTNQDVTFDQRPVPRFSCREGNPSPWDRQPTSME